MRRALAVGLAGALGVGAYVVYRRMQPVGPGSSLDDLRNAAPTPLDEEIDRVTNTQRAVDWRDTPDYQGPGVYKPTAQVLAEIPVPALRVAVAALAEAGRAHVGNGIRTTPTSTPADRAVIAEAAVRRAAHLGLIPATEIPNAFDALMTGNEWTYLAPGTRWSITISIGLWGLPSV